MNHKKELERSKIEYLIFILTLVRGFSLGIQRSRIITSHDAMSDDCKAPDTLIADPITSMLSRWGRNNCRKLDTIIVS